MTATKRSGNLLPVIAAATMKALTLVSVLSSMVSCTTISYPLGPTASPPSYKFLTGNWEFTTVPTAGSAQFGLFAGFINEASVNPGVDDPVTASLQIEEPPTCFLGTVVVPFDGDLKVANLGLVSFTDISQFVSIAATKDTTASHLVGTYSVGGGCASGSQGTLSGTKYAPLQGMYSGSIVGATSANVLTLTLFRSLSGNGDGTSNVTGTGTISGVPCFTSATLQPGNGRVLGSKANLLFTTSEPGGSQLSVIGTFNPAADLITATSITVRGGACSGTLGTAAFALL